MLSLSLIILMFLAFALTIPAVNPGNSGGALVNLKGELIGINTAIQSQTGSFAGYAFAVPSALAEKVVTDLKDYGMVQRALLGIKIMPVTAELAEEKGLDGLDGVYVDDVTKGSAALAAGLEKEDIIVEINGIKTNSPAELQEQVARYRPGNKIDVTYLRDGKTKTAQVTLKNIDGNTALLDKEKMSFNSKLGATLVTPDKEILKKLGIKEGLEVTNLRNGKIRNSGIREGFIITKVDRTPVNSEKQLKNILENKSTGILVEGYYPNGKRVYYAVDWS